MNPNYRYREKHVSNSVGIEIFCSLHLIEAPQSKPFENESILLEIQKDHILVSASDVCCTSWKPDGPIIRCHTRLPRTEPMKMNLHVRNKERNSGEQGTG